MNCEVPIARPTSSDSPLEQLKWGNQVNSWTRLDWIIGQKLEDSLGVFQVKRRESKNSWETTPLEPGNVAQKYSLPVFLPRIPVQEILISKVKM